MAEKSWYERYGLTGNPFRDLSSESIENVELFHVVQPLDSEIEQIRSEVLENENKAIVMLVGGLGMGKTERLMLTIKEAERHNAFCVLRNITPETKWVVKGIADAILEEAKKHKAGSFVSPSWLRHIKSLSRHAEKGYDPEEAGRSIAEALNSNPPSFLLLNDMHGLEDSKDIEIFTQTLHSLFDKVDKGVMIIITSDNDYFIKIFKGKESLKARINRYINIPPLNEAEANLFIAKRLLAKRVVEDMQPLYPFSETAIRAMNERAKGNPRELLKLAEVVIEKAARKKAVQINDEVALAFIAESAIPANDAENECE